MAILQVCAVLSTLALLSIAIGMLLLMLRIKSMADSLATSAESIRNVATRLEGFVNEEVHKLVENLQEVVPPIRRAAMHIEMVGERTAHLSNAVLEEVAAPIRTAVAVMRGVRAGTGQLFRSLARRTAHPDAPNNGGHDHA